ncbi:hypothetical protein ANANG_G00211220 [Anguilla anguilla]|uniref:Uncharacterized protein n=1 Tax=Anguilla anguilla TaxID=7936 RepID=A0A9D3M6Z7_ANGAN|nr:hypothetical protein ANANG_G00211220 [Anguilla anguilla]
MTGATSRPGFRLLPRTRRPRRPPPAPCRSAAGGGALPAHRAEPPGAAESARRQPAFSSILTILASTARSPETLVQSRVSPATSGSGNQTNQWPSEDAGRGEDPSSSAPDTTLTLSSSTEEIMTNDSSTDPPSLLSASREAGAYSTKNATSLPATRVGNATVLVQADNSSAPVVSTNRNKHHSGDSDKRHPSAHNGNHVDCGFDDGDRTTAAVPGTSASPPTSAASASAPSPRVTAPTSGLHATEGAPLQCNITEKLWVKTVLSVPARRSRLDGDALKLNLPRGLTRALQRAFNDSDVHAKVQSLTSDSNVTVGYYVVSSSAVYVPSAVVEALGAYGVDNLSADIRQFAPTVQSVSVAVAPWVSSPAASLQLKTVLRFVSPGDDVKTCSFVQRMEKRLEDAFAEAEAKALNSDSGLSVQILSSFKSPGSPSVSLTYVVRNGSAALNGTVSSNLLNRLTTELVGYFLFFPPLVIAEPLEYHNLNTSAATRGYWVITVIQDVDNSSLEGSYQSFASLMEQRLAELFMVAHQEGRRFRRAATVGSYTVQMVSIRRVPGPKSPAEMTYYVQLNGVPFSGTSAAKTLTTVDSQTMALTLGYFVQVQAEPVVKDPPSNLWIIAAVLVPIGVVTVAIFIIAAVLCRRNKGDFKTDALGNINSRAKTAYRREASYYHQPVQGFDYAKQHLGQQGGDEEALPDGSTSKKTLSGEIRKSRLPSEDGSVISNESGKLNSGRGSLVQKVPPPQKMTKEEARKRTDPYDTSSGSLQLISIKPMAAPPSYSHPASSDRSQDSAILNGEPWTAAAATAAGAGAAAAGQSYALRQMHGHHSVQLDIGRTPDPEEERASTYVKSRRRHSQMGAPAYRSRQSLSSPGPNATEMDLLVMRERSRRGVRNSGYDAFRFAQLPEMTMGSPPPPIPPRTGPPLVTSLRRSSSDIGPKSRTSECSVPEMSSTLDSDPYGPLSRVPLPAITADQSLSHYSGNPITAVYAIPASRAGYTGYFAPTPPSSYRSPSWMSYPPEPEDLTQQWTDLKPFAELNLSVALSGHSKTPGYPCRGTQRLSHTLDTPRAARSGWGRLHAVSRTRPPRPSPRPLDRARRTPRTPPGASLASISTVVLVKAIREEVAKLAKKQTDMFEFQV